MKITVALLLSFVLLLATGAVVRAAPEANSAAAAGGAVTSDEGTDSLRGVLRLVAKTFGTISLGSTPAVMNFALEEGRYKIDDIVAYCDHHKASGNSVVAQVTRPTKSSSSSGTVDGCQGAEFFLRMSPGLSKHVLLYIVRDEGSIYSASGRDGWSAVGNHGVAKRCMPWSFDECSVNRDMTYTSTYKDLHGVDSPVTVIDMDQSTTTKKKKKAVTAVQPAGNNSSSTVAADTTTSAPVKPASHPNFRLLENLPDGVEFDSRMAGSLYRLHGNAQHMLIEVHVPKDLAGHAFMQLEMRLTGHSATHITFFGLFACWGFVILFGSSLLALRKRALARHGFHEHLSPRQVWTIGGQTGGTVGAAVAPQLQLPEIVGKPVTPSRLEPKAKSRRGRPDVDGAATTASSASPAAASPPLSSAAAVPPEERDERTDEGHGGEAEMTPVAMAGGTAPSPNPAAAGWSAVVERLRNAVHMPPGGSERVPSADPAEAAEADDSETAKLAPEPSSTDAPAKDDEEDDDDDAAKPSPAASSEKRAPLPPGVVTVSMPSSSGSDADDVICRICQDADPKTELFAPCKCSGSSKYVHRSCLDQWRHSTTNHEHRSTCAECKSEYVTREELERQQRESDALPAPARGALACAKCFFIALRPAYALLCAMLVGGYAVKLGAFVLTGFDSGVHWLPSFYHMMLGFALLISEMMVVAHLCHFFSGYDVRYARVALFGLGYALPFAFGYIAMFFVWIVEITLLRPEAAFCSGVLCEFICSQYFLPTLNEYAARAELTAWLAQHAQNAAAERVVREEMATAQREQELAAREAARVVEADEARRAAEEANNDGDDEASDDDDDGDAHPAGHPAAAPSAPDDEPTGADGRNDDESPSSPPAAARTPSSNATSAPADANNGAATVATEEVASSPADDDEPAAASDDADEVHVG